MTGQQPFRDYHEYIEYPAEEMITRAREFHETLSRRRTIRHFSDRPVPREIIETCIAAAGQAPSGANLQPWHFACVSDPSVKTEIRQGAEAEERAFYERRASAEWLEALQPFETDANKPFLETAPWLIAVFGQVHSQRDDGTQQKHYYVQESVGIATGFLLAGLNAAGLCTLTHTPSPMKFLNKILDRPKNERPFLLIIVGYPVDGVRIPDIVKKPVAEIATWY